MLFEPIRIQGLAQYNSALRKLDKEAPKGLRLALNEAAQIVVVGARQKVERRTGRAAASLKARSTRTAVRVAAGGQRALHYPWLDWGGRVGRRKSVSRPFVPTGRYLYPTYYARQQEIQTTLERALADTVRRAGLDVD